MSSFADHLRAARHGYFVGREDERVLFRAILEAEDLPFHVLYIHGPGGVGKTALLREFLHLCEETNTPAHYLDARDVEPTAAAFMRGVQEGAGPAWLDGASHEGRFVLMIDTFETLAPLERWLREDFLPPLPAHVLLVLSSRNPLPVAWRADVGMKALVHTLALRNIGPKESRRYLARRGIPEAQHDRIVSFAHGLRWPSRSWLTPSISSPARRSLPSSRRTSSARSSSASCMRCLRPNTAPPFRPARSYMPSPSRSSLASSTQKTCVPSSTGCIRSPLRTLLREAAEALEADARTAKFYRALDATYLDPAPTQEKASERLDVPFSTFRRHLRRSLEHVTEALWQQETGNALARS